MIKAGTLALALLCAAVFLPDARAASQDTPDEALTLNQLASRISTLEKQEIILTGKVAGCCKSGCKMWLVEGEYKEGDLFALVRAKDDAFKFKTDSGGKTVVLRGYAVAKFLDYCGEKGEEHADGEQHAEGEKHAKYDKEECKAPVGTVKAKPAPDHPGQQDKQQKQELEGITFFATSVEYR